MLNQDFKEFIQSFNAEGVRYLVLGGYAVAFHGHPHYTKDLDVWIEASLDNASKIVSALDAFGFGSLKLKPQDFLAPDQFIQLGRAPCRIDIMTSAPGIVFGDCYERRVEAEVDGVTLPFLALDDLKRNKRAVGRHQDLADLERLP